MIEESARAALEKMFNDSFGSLGDDDLVVTLKQIVRGEDDISIPEEFLYEADDSEALDDETANLFAIIGEMGLPAKIKLALFGNKLARAILIRDTNRRVSLVVLSNSRLTEVEVVEFAKNSNLDESIHRTIAKNTAWMKNYEMKLAVVSNPKVPMDISMKYVKYLNDRDLKRLSRSKNIPQVIATQCGKVAEKRGK